jgi:hypothetical protein
MGWAVAGPIIAGAVGGAAQSEGAKKAAKNSQPQVPEQFQRSAGLAANNINRYLVRGLPQWGGPFTVGLNPMQQGSLSSIQGLLGAGQNGMNAAQGTIERAAAEGLNPADIDLARSQSQGLFDFNQQRGLAQLREGQAAGGRFFGTGAVGAEGDFLRGLTSEREAMLLPLALQMQQLRLGAAGMLPQFLAGGIQNQMMGFQAGEQERSLGQQDLNARYQEFLRTNPAAAIPLLANLMGSTPFYNPTVPPNFGMLFGQGMMGLGQSPGFANAFPNYFGAQPGKG